MQMCFFYYSSLDAKYLDSKIPHSTKIDENNLTEIPIKSDWNTNINHLKIVRILRICGNPSF